MNQVEAVYQEVIAKLKNDQRPLIKLDADLEAELQRNWKEGLDQNDYQKIQKVLCLLDNTQNTSGAFEELFVRSLEELIQSDQIICVLGASSKHMITHAQKNALPINHRYTQVLLTLLHTDNPEVLEWVLRTVEQYGAQSIRFREEILKHKPSFLAFLNTHKKNAKEIIELLEKRWEALVKGL